MDLEIDKLGRVVIPKPLRDRLHLAPGTRLRVEERGEGLYLEPVQAEGGGLIERDGFLLWAGKLPADWDVVAAIKREREARIRKVGRW